MIVTVICGPDSILEDPVGVLFLTVLNPACGEHNLVGHLTEFWKGLIDGGIGIVIRCQLDCDFVQGLLPGDFLPLARAPWAHPLQWIPQQVGVVEGLGCSL